MNAIPTLVPILADRGDGIRSGASGRARVALGAFRNTPQHEALRFPDYRGPHGRLSLRVLRTPGRGRWQRHEASRLVLRFGGAHFSALERNRAQQSDLPPQARASTARREEREASSADDREAPLGLESRASEEAALPDARAETPTSTSRYAPGAYWTDFRGPDRDGRYDEADILTSWPAEGLPMLWRQPIGGGSGPRRGRAGCPAGYGAWLLPAHSGAATGPGVPPARACRGGRADRGRLTNAPRARRSRSRHPPRIEASLLARLERGPPLSASPPRQEAPTLSLPTPRTTPHSSASVTHHG